MSRMSLEIDESALLDALRAGRDDAFERLVRTYGGRLLSVTRRYLGGAEEAHDAVQETFIAAFRAIGSFRGDSSLATWLRHIAVNVCLMKLRTRRRHPEEPIEALLPRWGGDGHHLVPPRGWGEPPDARLERSEDLAFVRECIERLPESYRTVLMMRDIDGLDTGRTAGLLGVTEASARVRLHRARQALRAMLDQRFGAAGR